MMKERNLSDASLTNMAREMKPEAQVTITHFPKNHETGAQPVRVEVARPGEIYVCTGDAKWTRQEWATFFARRFSKPPAGAVPIRKYRKRGK